MGFLVVGILSIVSAIFYRMGGSGNYPRQARMVGVPLCTILALWAILGVNWGMWWVYAICMGLSVGLISTYWDEVFGFDNFWFHAFAVGLAVLPLMALGVHWYAILARSIIMGGLIGGLSYWQKWDVLEESTRGFFIVATIPLLLL